MSVSWGQMAHNDRDLDCKCHGLAQGRGSLAAATRPQQFPRPLPVAAQSRHMPERGSYAVALAPSGMLIVTKKSQSQAPLGPGLTHSCWLQTSVRQCRLHHRDLRRLTVSQPD
jgi:hypothetical protein